MNLTLCNDFDKIDDLVKIGAGALKAKVFNVLTYDDFYQEGWVVMLKYFEKHDSIEDNWVSNKVYLGVLDFIRTWTHIRVKGVKGLSFVELFDDDVVYFDYHHSIISEDVKNLIEEYGKKKNKVLQMYYLDDMTMLEIAKECDLTESRICQIVGDFKNVCKRRLKDEILLYHK